MKKHEKTAKILDTVYTHTHTDNLINKGISSEKLGFICILVIFLRKIDGKKIVYLFCVQKEHIDTG